MARSHLRRPAPPPLPAAGDAAGSGLLLPATLARHLGLPELVRQRLDLGDAPGSGERRCDKMMTLVASALAGGDCIDDADVLRTGGTACTLGGTSQGAIHPGHLPAQGLPVVATSVNSTG